jgi:hypothetical protein
MRVLHLYVISSVLKIMEIIQVNIMTSIRISNVSYNNQSSYKSFVFFLCLFDINTLRMSSGKSKHVAVSVDYMRKYTLQYFSVY